jgi:hypothetical protein
MGTFATRDDINDYMDKHPNYDPSKDPYLQTRRVQFAFNSIRSNYWTEQARKAGVCTICSSEGSRLMYYYDYHQVILRQGWDSSKVDWGDVGFDLAGIGASVFSMNEVVSYFKLSESAKEGISVVSFGLNAVSVLNAAGQPPEFQNVFTVLGFWPGVVGGVASGASLIFDLGNGGYQYQYVPSISN